MRPFLTKLPMLALLLAAAPAVAQGTAFGAPPDDAIGHGWSLPVSVQASNSSAENTRGELAPPLPLPAAGEDATPMDYLRSARAAILANRTGEAQEALERAEARLLDRDVDPRRANEAASDQSVRDLAQARAALSSGDRGRTLELIEAVLTRQP